MKYVISFTTIICSAVVLLFGLTFFSVNANAPFASVEIGLSELSPAGEIGGRAMPASGASVELSYRQTGETTWRTENPGILPDDDAVQLRWQNVSGSGASMDNCTFIAGYRAPSGQQANSGTSVDGSRVLSAVGNSSTYTIECTDLHSESGHNGVPYTDTDTALLMLQTECNDGVDNADPEDTLADANDPGCHTDGDPNDGDVTYDPLDDNEEDNSPSMTLEGCSDSTCVDSGGTLTIDEFDTVTVNWTSQNTDSCQSLGTFNMTGSPTSGSDGVVEPEVGETSVYSVACTPTDSSYQVMVRSVSVRHPAIRLIPDPNPPIVPANFESAGNTATVEPQIEGYLPGFCTLEGPGVNDTIANLTAAGLLTDGTYEVDLNEQGETTYVLECRSIDADGNPTGNPVSDSATFRILPTIQET